MARNVKKPVAGSGAAGMTTVSNTAIALPGTIPTVPASALLSVEGSTGIRWRDDGTNPTTAVGHKVAGGGSVVLDCDLSRVKIIRDGASDATVFVSYYEES